MTEFGKHIGFVLTALLLWITVNRREKDMAVLLTLAVCCGVAAVAARYLMPVMDLIRQLESLGHLQEGIVKILMKAVGIGFLSETAGTVCQDAGNGSMGNMVRFFGSCMILYVSVPVFQSVITLVQEILGIL